MADPELFDYYEPGMDSIDDILDHSKHPNYNRSRDLDRKTEDERIKKITAELIETIDQLDHNFKRARDRILDLARVLDESKTCPRDQIGRYIKGILKDKIEEGKISVRWIHESLPKEYKREYRKREVSSLSQNNVSIEHSGSMDQVLVHKAPQNEDSTNQEFLPTLSKVERKSESNVCTNENIGPKSDPKQLMERIKFIIDKSQKDLINKGLEDCKQFCFLSFNKSRVLVGVTSDRSVEVQ